MAETTFLIGYDGPALTSGRMDVRDLAPSLIALADLVQDAHVGLHPDDPPVAVEVTATSTGSFDVHLVIAHKLLEYLTTVFASQPAAAAANLAQLVTVLVGTIRFVKHLRGRRIRSQEPLANGDIRIKFDDDTEVIVPQPSVPMAQKVTIRKTLKKMLEPLSKDGIDRFYVRESTEVSLEIGGAEVGKDDLPAFEVPPVGEDVVNEAVQNVVVSIASPNFVEGNKWRLSLGDTSFFAAIEDPVFVARVQAGEAFSRHDLLRVRLRLRQIRDDEGNLHDKHIVEEVLEHVIPAAQVPLPFETGADGADED